MTGSRTDGGRPVAFAWLAGIAAVVLGAGVGELVAAIFVPESSPFAAIGGALIDLAPSWAKDTAIALFGTADKIALLAGIALVALALAALAGVIEARWPPWGITIVVGFGVAGAVIAVGRSGAGPLAWLPSAVAGVVGGACLWFLIRMLRRAQAAASGVPRPASAPASEEIPRSEDGSASQSPRDRGFQGQAGNGVDRRGFFAVAGIATVVGIVGAIAGNAVRAGSQAFNAARSAIRLPKAVNTVTVPADAELGIPGLADVITPNDSFYRIDTALIVPEIDAEGWSLRVHGMVEEEFFLSWNELLSLPLEESVTTLACVSNPVGGTLVGNAVWLGYPIREILARAKPLAGADMVLSKSRDGFSASTPLEVLTDDRNAILAVGMNGEPLPLEHGFPVRMVVPGLYGYVSATKWVTSLEVTRFDQARAYWTDRGWSERGPIKLQSRIDVPRKAQGLKAGDTVIAGVAWYQQTGVTGVEVQIDEGEWMPATLATAISDDTWVQWSIPWTATEGDHLIRCRAIATTGEVQTSDHANPAPDGATGWHERYIEVFA